MTNLEIHHFLDEPRPLPLLLFDKLTPLIKIYFHKTAEHVETDMHEGVYLELFITIYN